MAELGHGETGIDFEAFNWTERRSLMMGRMLWAKMDRGIFCDCMPVATTT